MRLALLLSTVLLAPASTARDAATTASSGRPARAEEPAQDVVRLTAWPAPADLGALRLDVERLRKARTPEMVAGARAGLVAAGAAAVPELLDALAKERSPETRERIAALIGELTGAEHTRLLARELDRPASAVRIVALRRIAAFPDAELRAAAEGHLERTAARSAEADAEELYAAALCATSTGSLAGLDELCRAAGAAWSGRADEMLRALRGARGREASALVASWLAQTDERRLGALRLLAGVGDPAAARAVLPALDDPDPALRVAAINALRAIVDGDPPLERLAVFEAIEQAQRWKERMR